MIGRKPEQGALDRADGRGWMAARSHLIDVCRACPPVWTGDAETERESHAGRHAEVGACEKECQAGAPRGHHHHAQDEECHFTERNMV